MEIDASVTAAAADEYELTAETFVMHSGLGMTWNPTQITRPGASSPSAVVSSRCPPAAAPGRAHCACLV